MTTPHLVSATFKILDDHKDLVTALFETTGSLMIWRNVQSLYKAKHFAGVRIGPTAFFAAWGFWNLFYYPHLQQWKSFVGGVCITTANTVWVGLMIYYWRKDSNKSQAVETSGLLTRIPSTTILSAQTAKVEVNAFGPSKSDAIEASGLTAPVLSPSGLGAQTKENEMKAFDSDKSDPVGVAGSPTSVSSSRTPPAA
jgi:hypothetical protein